MNNPFEQIDARLTNIEALLVSMKETTHHLSKPAVEDELLTVQDAAKLLKLSVPTIYGLISKGGIPVMKRSKRCYFSKLELINYMKEGRKKPLSEINAIAEKHVKGKGL